MTKAKGKENQCEKKESQNNKCSGSYLEDDNRCIRFSLR